MNLEENKIIILETKVSLNDYKKDNKKDNYIEYCNELGTVCLLYTSNSRGKKYIKKWISNYVFKTTYIFKSC